MIQPTFHSRACAWLPVGLIVACVACETASDRQGHTAETTASATVSASAASSGLRGRAPDQPPDTLAVAEIQDRFEADERTLVGKKVRVYGRYHSMSRATTDGATVFSINVVDDGEVRPSIPCQLDKEPTDLNKHDKLVAEGIVERLFGASLNNCNYTKL